MKAAPVCLPLSTDELPDITDAGVGLTLLMVASLLAQREHQALHGQIATAIEARDWTAAAALHRRLAEVAPAVPRMADVARAGIQRFDGGHADPATDPADNARARRSLVRAANWLDKRFWPMYGTVRPVVPPAADTPPPAATSGRGKARPAMPPLSRPPPLATKPCRKTVKSRLQLLDGELARLGGDARPAAAAARLIMLADRNDHAARCRACGRCRLAADPLTRPIPTD